MRSLRLNPGIFFGAILPAALLLLPSIPQTQGNTQVANSNTLTQIDAGEAYQQYSEKYLQRNLGDPREDAAYRTFHKVAQQDADEKITTKLINGPARSANR
ncbi:MAG: hypothetical protein WA369_10435 [Candidatus Acidiferrales bacterium]